VNRKYRQKPDFMNKILTQGVRIGFDAHKHRRNLNVLVIGRSGAGKTRFYVKPNVMQGNCSMAVLDPHGETNYSHFFYIFSKERRYIKWLNFKVSRLQPYMKGFPKTMSCKVKVIVF
jgi:type IV secretion system protein VirD4